MRSTFRSKSSAWRSKSLIPARPRIVVSSSFATRSRIDADEAVAATWPDSDTRFSASPSAVSTGTSKRLMRSRSENVGTSIGPDARSAEDHFAASSEPVASTPSARSR